MNPDKARQTIEALLSLGTLKGVKVRYEDEETRIFYFSPSGTLQRGTLEPGYYGVDDEVFEGIVSIEPIPTTPKLLEVGEEVRIVGGRAKGKKGIILKRQEAYYEVDSGNEYGDIAVSYHNVIPESLLDEEEKVGYITLPLPIELAAIVNKHFLDSSYLGKDWEAVRKSLIQELKHVVEEQAGYTVTKNVCEK